MLLSLDAPGALKLAGLGSLQVDRGSYDLDHILVRYREGTLANHKADGVDLEGVPGLREIKLPKGLGVEKALEAHRKDPNVLYAEPDYEVRISVVPNDPQFGFLWGLNNTGQDGGVVDADIDAPEAWDVTTGSASTIVAVIDSGVDYTHPDLAANIWTNTREIPGNRIDDDGNGYADDVHGYDFANGDSDPMDDNGHGTHVAGTIAAVSDNGVGVAGVAPSVKIMALKFLGASGSGSTSAAISALNYAVANGATISNNSWGGGGSSQALSDAIHNAAAKGHIFVTAAGNGGSDGVGDNNDSVANYPSNYNLDNIVAVAATDRNNRLASFSNYGRTSVDLAAPGVSILSTTPRNTYSTYSGTSMATPHVTGVLALVRSQHPAWSYSQVIDRVLSTVDPIPFLSDRVATGGRLNAARAVAGTSNPPSDPPSTDTTGARVTAHTPSGTVGGLVGSVRVTFSEAIDPTTFTAADANLSLPDGSAAPVSGVATVAGSGNTQFDVTFASRSAAGSYRLALGPDIRDLAGNPMDQNRNGVNGESADQYVAAFTIGPAQAAIGSDSTYQALPATYEAIDLVPGASGVKTLLNSGDDTAVSVNLGGSFNFYGTAYTTAYVSTNGLITFGGGNSSASNTDLTVGPNQRLIAPLWDDWVSTTGNSILLSRVDDPNGDGTADRVVIEWNKVQGYSTSPSPVTFQVILKLNTGSSPGDIVFNYPDLDAGNFRTDGGSATVGIEDLGTQADRRIPISYNSGTNVYVATGKAIRFSARSTSPGTPTAPAAPSNLAAAAVSSTQINLSWSDNASNEAGYQIERSSDGVTWARAGSVAANVTRFSDNGLAASTTYYYRVVALGAGLNSTPSNVAKATTPSGVTPPPTSPDLSAIEQRIVELVNIERQKAGLAPLTVNSKLLRAAQIQADQMVAFGTMSHTLPGAQYPTPSDRLKAVEYSWRSYGENIAYGYTTAESVMAAWMGSTGHRANILGGSYTEIGVGVSYDSAGRAYYCQVFGRPA